MLLLREEGRKGKNIVAGDKHRRELGVPLVPRAQEMEGNLVLGNITVRGAFHHCSCHTDAHTQPHFDLTPH